MEINQGTLDRILRIIVGCILLGLYVEGPRSSWELAGAIPLVTGVMGVCPVYWLLGIDTCEHDPAHY